MLLMLTYTPSLVQRGQADRRRSHLKLMIFALLISTLDRDVNAQPTRGPKASALLERAAPASKNTVARARGVITRGEINVAVKGGIPQLLAQARTTPARREGRFYGFTLREIQASSLVERAGFRAGDVIISVNDEPIGRPEQMMHVLSILPFAQNLIIRFERQGITREWTWLIRD